MSVPIEHSIESIAILMLEDQIDLSGVQIRHRDDDNKAGRDRISITVESKRPFSDGFNPSQPPAATQADVTIMASITARDASLVATWIAAIDSAMSSTPPDEAQDIFDTLALTQLTFRNAAEGRHQSVGAEVRTWEKTYQVVFW